jgi:hypothetical protein
VVVFAGLAVAIMSPRGGHPVRLPRPPGALQ